MATINKELEQHLDKIKIEAYTGEYYWRARDIEFLLDNCTWNKLYKSILKIEKQCKEDGLDTSKDIIRTKTTINDGYERQMVDDFYLSNLIAYQLFSEYNEKNNQSKKTIRMNPKVMKLPKKVFLYLFSFFAAMFTILAVTVLCIFYIPLKPFQEIRNLYVSTAMTTYTHQWLAKIFFSEETINEIMTEYVAPDFEEDTIKTEGYGKKENILQVFDVSGSGFTGKLLKISNPEQVIVGISQTMGTNGQFLQDIIKNYDAVAGINGSGFIDENGKGKAAYPVGILISEGKWIYDPQQEEYDVIGFDNENTLIVGTYTKKEIEELHLRDAVEPFYKLIVNGNKRIKSGNGGYGLHPRTAIGQTLDGSVLMLVIDGRQLHSIGATMKDCQDILASYGAINAAALDGGSSSIMYYDGKVQTKPSNGTTYGRYLPSAFIVTKNDI
ncbi:MAG: phosphodiester glycosidase family protein [Clostridia bacterium]|nr:phosphodiester glycosidase family protein [Clostridia bacterium]